MPCCSLHKCSHLVQITFDGQVKVRDSLCAVAGDTRTGGSKSFSSMFAQEWINNGMPTQRGLPPTGLPVHGPMVARTATNGYSPGLTSSASRTTILQKRAVTCARPLLRSAPDQTCQLGPTRDRGEVCRRDNSLCSGRAS